MGFQCHVPAHHTGSELSIVGTNMAEPPTSSCRWPVTPPLGSGGYTASFGRHFTCHNQIAASCPRSVEADINTERIIPFHRNRNEGNIEVRSREATGDDDNEIALDGRKTTRLIKTMAAITSSIFQPRRRRFLVGTGITPDDRPRISPLRLPGVMISNIAAPARLNAQAGIAQHANGDSR